MISIDIAAKDDNLKSSAVLAPGYRYYLNAIIAWQQHTSTTGARRRRYFLAMTDSRATLK